MNDTKRLFRMNETHFSTTKKRKDSERMRDPGSREMVKK